MEQVEITNDCTCEEIKNPQVGYEPADECYGCYKDSLYDLQELLGTWRTAQGIDEETTVDLLGMNVGWQRTRAKGVCLPKVHDIMDIMKINGDWRMVFKIQGNLLTIWRYSHDEPTGSVWEIHSRGRRR